MVIQKAQLIWYNWVDLELSLEGLECTQDLPYQILVCPEIKPCYLITSNHYMENNTQIMSAYYFDVFSWLGWWVQGKSHSEVFRMPWADKLSGRIISLFSSGRPLTIAFGSRGDLNRPIVTWTCIFRAVRVCPFLLIANCCTGWAGLGCARRQHKAGQAGRPQVLHHSHAFTFISLCWLKIKAGFLISDAVISWPTLSSLV